MLDILSASDLAADLIERTSRTTDVQRALELSLTPAFLLVGIGGIMNVMMARLIWIAGRIERLSESSDISCEVTHGAEVKWLCARRRFARRAIMLSTSAAAVISLVIALLFVSAYIEARIGTAIAVLWVATMGLLITGLVNFGLETKLAANGFKTERGL
ncbi:MAG: DUF2721 domain-containing protein [Pseudomonadota bacterium]